LSFTSFSIIEPFENDDTMVVLTALGNYFKVGNAMENDYFVTFDYQQLVPEQQLPPVPEPATILLVGTGIAVIAGARFRRNKK
ncbi:MAG TPA: PEP-CTERM sorting domain-containing protein, partial [Thermodesulfovibrionia bacterium]|nr:PEP-CTERM sorting domain-containing protein [Thermodesulfovibrionia bacterium]